MKSFYIHPRVVIAGLPILIPDGTNALLSPGTVFLFIDIPISLQMASILAPSNLLLLMSNKNKWFSVPPDTTWYPSSIAFLQAVWIFLTT